VSGRLLRASQVAIDLVALLVSFVVAYFIRFDGAPPAQMTARLFLTAPYVVAIEYVILVAFGIHRYSWRYIGLREASRMALAVTTGAAVLLGIRLVIGQISHTSSFGHQALIPIGVLLINFALTFLAVTGVRVTRRMLGESVESGRRAASNKQATPTIPTILIGAGQAGLMVAREIAARPDLGLRVVGFVDDDPRKVGTVMQGVRVLGETVKLPEICTKYKAQQGLITMANVPGNTIRRIRRLCEEAGIPTKIIPGVYEMIGGQVNLSRIRDINIEDLLRREPVELDLAGIASDIQNKVVLTTGAGGSIGSELCRQICRFLPAAIVLVERSENALFNIHRDLLAAHPNLRIIPCIADITDVPRMDELFATYQPTLVFHAAAHKHVPMMEWNPVEAVKNNVLGTKVVADLASSHKVEAFVMISTDKAVNPTSVMGATKRAAELYVQALSQLSTTRFVTVRFGNVLGSAGSVIPIFREQIAEGGPVTVTHPEMRRYFMTIPEACQLVLQAGALGRGGEIFILDMGEPVKIVDLARELIALSGLEEGEDVDIVFSGMRPGEKLFEELSTDAEHADRTRHPKIFVGRIEAGVWADLTVQIAALKDAVEGRSSALVLQGLSRMVPAYACQTPAPAMAPPLGDRSDVPAPSPVFGELLAN
jgi:FlaA1/EpsC-like NDP-sugar epimerase